MSNTVWHKYSEEKPKKSGNYLVFDGRHNSYNIFPFVTSSDAEKHNNNVDTLRRKLEELNREDAGYINKRNRAFRSFARKMSKMNNLIPGLSYEKCHCGDSFVDIYRYDLSLEKAQLCGDEFYWMPLPKQPIEKEGFINE